jgi:hypothetical protein
MRKSLVVFSALMFFTGLTACSSESSGEPQSTTSAAVVENPYGGPDVPPPSPDEPILKLINGEKTLSLSLNDLRALPQVEVRVFEPFVKSEISFKGVAMDELFGLVDIQSDDKVLTVALNDYTYSNFAREFVGTEAFLAYEQDGGAILMSRGGPIRIIVPNNKSLTESLEVWNWSLAEIRVE